MLNAEVRLNAEGGMLKAEVLKYGRGESGEEYLRNIRMRRISPE
jgi:hypothetical protein